ncbi:MAG TPA: hypothetical protein VEI07_11955 [Planctomycetaceae bacterium]|nr:hypothetical protein [Planctomycetaceae bacterium]
MKHKGPSRKQLESLCAEVNPDDGLDPKVFSRRSKRPWPSREKNPVHRKTLQLCSQVADTLNLVLSGECADEVLQCLQVVSVTPAPNAAQLLVLVTASGDLAPDPARVLKHLAAASGRLRTEVAGAIVRRRAPTLVFQYLGAQRTKEPRTK